MLSLAMFYILNLLWIANNFIGFAHAQVASNIPEPEMYALHDFFLSTDGASWDWSPGNESGAVWNFTADANPCADNWQGVTCTAEIAGQDRHIAEILLPGYYLRGTIPESIGNWTYLETLFLPNNVLFGSIPVTPWVFLGNVTVINFNLNYLTGSIPPSLGQLRRLTELQLVYNELNGTIPETLGNANRLIILHLNNNPELSGTIPAILGSLYYLESITMFYTHVSGAIPAELGALSRLLELLIFHTFLTGPIPGSLGQLTNLTVLALSNARLNGTIPEALCQLTNLVGLGLGGNDLSATIPSCFGELTELVFISTAYNRLEGPIPAALAALDQLEVFDVSGNFLTGPIPTFLCRATEMTHIYVYDNSLTGTVPDCLAEVPLLEALGGWGNELVGMLPPGLMLLPNMTNLWFGYNYLTGTIADFGATKMEELALYSNFFTGTVPDCFGALTSMSVLEMGHNLFTGALPPSVGYLPRLLQLDLETNLFTGAIPATLSMLNETQEIFLNANFLSGSLDGMMNASTQQQLSTLFVQDNQLTGPLPDELFRLPLLSTFVAVSNCFTGTLSSAVCDSPKMVSLVLDGLHTSPACRRSLIAATHSYQAVNNFHGTIPACIFHMKSLISLHLSGNGLTGTLPAGDSAVVRHLVDLTLSHNSLTGTVPVNLQTRNWRTLDLSYNRLTGGLEPSFGVALQEHFEIFINASFNATGNSVAMQNNRLSGQFPTPLKQMHNVSMLGSNLFSCKVDKSDLPKHDSDRANYLCGSDAFNAPFYVVIAASILFLLLAGCYVQRSALHSKTLADVARWLQAWTEAVRDSPPSLHNVLGVSDILCRVGAAATIIIVLVLVPWYVAASHYYGTYTYQYAWVVSAAFLSGVTPAATEFALYLVVTSALGAVVIGLQRTLPVALQDIDKIAPARALSLVESATVLAGSWQRTAVFALILCVNMLVVGGVNAAFVTVALTQSSGLFVLAQIIMSLFKLFWNAVCTPYLIGVAAQLTSQGAEDPSLNTLHVFLGLFNNIAIPCLVVAVLSPSCFYNIFDAPPVVTSTYVIQDCYFGTVVEYCTYYYQIYLRSSYNPPFAYSYQCSSSFVTYYAPAFVYLGLAAGVAAPLAKVAAVVLLRNTPAGGSLHAALMRLIPRVLSLQHPDDLVDSSAVAVREPALFNAKTFVVSLITYLGILLTFGVVFPPLAVVMCATMLSVAWQSKLALGRFLHDATERSLPNQIAALDRNCRAATSSQQLQRSLFLIICFACCFYALFLFDTLGDAVGPRNAYWVLIVFPLLPLVLVAVSAVSAAGRKKPAAATAVEPSRINSVLEMKASVSDRGSRASAGSGRAQSNQDQAAGDDREQDCSKETYNALQVSSAVV